MAALVGTSGSDTLLGDAAADVISGLDGNDTLYGGAGSDTLEGGLGADRMFGGDGIDTATYANSAAGVTATLGGPVGSGGDAQGDVLFSIENLLGSALGDRLTGSAFGNRIEGGAGNDTLIGGGGADQLFGGAGTDRADYTSSGAAVTVALGGAVGSGGDAEGDRLYYIENLIGSAFDDRLTGTAFGNRIEGADGNDTLIGGGGPDQLFGGNGIDAADYSGSAAGVTAILGGAAGSGGEAEGDTLYFIEDLIGSGFADVLTGAAIANRLSGGAGDDTLQGGGGDDTLAGGEGADRIDGGAGRDTADYSGSAAGVTVALDGSGGSGGEAAGDMLAQIEDLVGSSQADLLGGDSAANHIHGGAGNDTILGSGGADSLDGGDGRDTVAYSNSASSVTAHLDGTAGIGGEAEGDMLANVERLVGSAFDDRLNGFVGNDTLAGGAGADELHAGFGEDFLDYSGSASGVTVKLDGTVAAGGDAQGDQLFDFEHVLGSGLGDNFEGNASNNRLFGGGGDDTLFVGLGHDTAYGGIGADTLWSGGDDDAQTRDFMFGGEGDDIFRRDQLDYCNGGNGYDRLLTGSCSTLDIDRIEEVIVSFGTVSVGLDQIDDLERIRGGSSTLVQLESFESWTRSTLTANFFLWTGPNGEELWIHQNCYVTDLEQ